MASEEARNPATSVPRSIGIAIGVIEAGMCKSVVCFRSMNGATGFRMGGSGRGARALSGDDAPEGDA